MEWKNIKKDIRELDLIFFKGAEMVSDIIRFMSSIECDTKYSDCWSHVGIVITKRMLPSINSKCKDDELLLWESTISSRHEIINGGVDALDVESDSPIFGVQIRKLEDVIKKSLKNKQTIGWSRLINNPLYSSENKVIEETKNKLSDIHKRYFHRSYQKDICKLFSSMCSCFKNCQLCNKSDDWVFCSQFVSIIYRDIGIIKKEIKTEEIIPQDLANVEKSEEKEKYGRFINLEEVKVII